MISIDIGKESTPQCGEDCHTFVDRWAFWCQDHHRGKLALLDVTSPNRYFDKVLDAKSRNMIRKSEKNDFTYRQFSYNSYLIPIYDINTSRETRQGKPMTEGYTTPPAPISRRYELCEIHQNIWIGGFKDLQLLAYCNLIILKDIAIINRILGHDKALTYGVMNGLMNKLVWISYRAHVKYLNYLDLESCTEGLNRFKRSVGFESHEVAFT